MRRPCWVLETTAQQQTAHTTNTQEQTKHNKYATAHNTQQTRKSKSHIANRKISRSKAREKSRKSHLRQYANEIGHPAPVPQQLIVGVTCHACHTCRTCHTRHTCHNAWVRRQTSEFAFVQRRVTTAARDTHLMIVQVQPGFKPDHMSRVRSHVIQPSLKPLVLGVAGNGKRVDDGQGVVLVG